MPSCYSVLSKEMLLSLIMKKQCLYFHPNMPKSIGRLVWKKKCFSASASKPDMGLINKG